MMNKKSSKSAMIIIFIMLFTTIEQASSLTTVFIEPWQANQLCNISLSAESMLCDSIMNTLEQANNQGITDLQLILLQNQFNIDHYFLEAELSIDQSSVYYNYSSYLQYSNGN